MRCAKCGADIPNNELRCEFCGHIVQMVPDYNPLEEVVTSEVRSSITGRFDTVDRERRKSLEEKKRSEAQAREMAARRRRQAERNRQIKRKKQKLAIITIASCIVILIICGVLVQRNSYSGLINRGTKEAEEKNTVEAVELYTKAISKKPSKSEAYLVLSEMYYVKQDWGKAEEVLLQGTKANPDNEALHKAVVEFYQKSGQEEKVMAFYTECNKKMKSVLDAYNSETPVFSLKEGSYDDVQELTLTSNGTAIFYTDDGTDPTNASILYEDAIHLKEGVTVISAISYNAEGIPSAITSFEYVIVLPIEGAPIVNPSTGQYKEETQIVITVPEGYQAYYTMDGSTPSATSKKYNGAINMPEGNTIFSAVLINGSGKSSDVTKRNYSLVLADDEEVSVE